MWHMGLTALFGTKHLNLLDVEWWKCHTEWYGECLRRRGAEDVSDVAVDDDGGYRARGLDLPRRPAGGRGDEHRPGACRRRDVLWPRAPRRMALPPPKRVATRLRRPRDAGLRRPRAGFGRGMGGRHAPPVGGGVASDRCRAQSVPAAGRRTDDTDSRPRMAERADHRSRASGAAVRQGKKRRRRALARRRLGLALGRRLADRAPF